MGFKEPLPVKSYLITLFLDKVDFNEVYELFLLSYDYELTFGKYLFLSVFNIFELDLD
jgi:hypothetical protein